MFPSRDSNGRERLSGIALVAVVALALALPAGDGVAAQAASPVNTAEPAINGRAEQGRTLSTSNGS